MNANLKDWSGKLIATPFKQEGSQDKGSTRTWKVVLYGGAIAFDNQEHFSKDCTGTPGKPLKLQFVGCVLKHAGVCDAIPGGAGRKPFPS